MTRRARHVAIDLSGWESFRERQTDGSIGLGRRPVPIDERIERALGQTAWLAVRIWCPEHRSGAAHLAGEVMATTQGPLALVYSRGVDPSTGRWAQLMGAFEPGKVREETWAAPSMLDDLDHELRMCCPTHGRLQASGEAVREAVTRATRDQPVNLRAQRM